MSVTVTVVNDLQPKIFGPQDHPGFPMLQVGGALLVQVEFDGSHSFYRAFQNVQPGASVSFVQDGGPAQTTLSITVAAPFQRTQSQSGIVVDMSQDITLTTLYFVPNWSNAQADYGLQIGAQPIVDLGYAASVS